MPMVLRYMVSCGVSAQSLTAGITGGPNSTKDGVAGTQEDRRVEHLLPESVKQNGLYECYVEVS